MATEEHDKYLDIAGVAEQFGTNPRHVRRLMAEQGLPYIKLGRLVRFSQRDLDAWTAARRVERVLA
jgi:excisionase family DNA binding protein